MDDEIHAGIEQGVSEFPKFKIVGSVHGDWAQDVAQKAVAGVLPSLPEIVGVVTDEVACTAATMFSMPAP